MIDSVDSRLQNASAPSSSMKLFTGIGSQYSGNTFVANANNWLHDLRSQLNGFHMGAGAWGQSYGAIPLGDRFLLSCGHNGPEVGKPLKYVKEDGTVFSTTISHWINDFPNGDADMSIYVTSTALPAWVYRAPIINLPNALRELLTPYNPPTVGITQGNYTAGPAAAYGYYNTPDNRMVRVAALDGVNPSTTLRTPLYHYSVVGDSGSPDYALIGNTLYLLRIVLMGGGYGQCVCDYIEYINSMIARGATAAGISPITVVAVEPPTL